MMTRNEIDQNNLKFFQETVASEGFEGFKKWYDKQEKRIQNYYRDLLRLYTIEILDFIQDLEPNVDQASRVLCKFKTDPKVDNK